MELSTFQEWFDWIPRERLWIAETFTIVFLTLLVDFVHKKILRGIYKKIQSTKSLWDDALVNAVMGPSSLLIWVVGLSLAAGVIDFKPVTILRTVAVIAIVSWVLVRFVTFVEKKIILEAEATAEIIDRTTAHAITQLLRISIIITAVLVTLQSLGFNISAVLAFGGIGGIAVGFAAKDLLANFFGGLMIYLDRPFAIGDWIRSPDKEIEGVVEKIGWRLTRIRTFDKRPLYIPNATFTTISVQNPSRMTNRRIYETIGIRYADIEKMAAIVADVEKMLQAHEAIDAGKTLMVNFNTFGASSLDFFVYTFTRTTDWRQYHRIKQDVLLKIADIINQHGAEIAFPTRSLYVENQTLPVTVMERGE